MDDRESLEEFYKNEAEKISRAEKQRAYVTLAAEMAEVREGFPFQGINQESYTTIKAEQERYPGYSTPIDELTVTFREQGFRVTLGDHPESGKAFILPLHSTDMDDNLFPRHLAVASGMDEKLIRLIELSKELYRI